MPSRKLTLDDIADLRAYERERAEFRARIIALKKLRRVQLGDLASLVFENDVTMRWQIQEMARAEKIFTDEGIENELRAYNPLIPEPGELSATLFLELSGEAQLREWLPKLLGVERAVEIRLPGGDVIASVPEAGHEAALTRETETSAVHYIRFPFTDAQIDDFARGGAVMALNHPAYQAAAPLSAEATAELLHDLR